ncbi:MAG: hypothetical protein Q9227_009157 [Pyrenula ochraceoflavens]
MTMTRSGPRRSAADASIRLSKKIPSSYSLHGHRFNNNDSDKDRGEEQRPASARSDSSDVFAPPKSESEEEASDGKDRAREISEPGPVFHQPDILFSRSPRDHAVNARHHGIRETGHGSKKAFGNVHATSQPRQAREGSHGKVGDHLHKWANNTADEPPAKRAKTKTYGGAPSFKTPKEVTVPQMPEDEPPAPPFQMPTMSTIKRSSPPRENPRFIQPKSVDILQRGQPKSSMLMDEDPRRSQRVDESLLQDFEKSKDLLAKDDFLGCHSKELPDLDDILHKPAASSLVSQNSSSCTFSIPPIFDTDHQSGVSTPLSSAVSIDSPSQLMEEGDKPDLIQCPLCSRLVSRSSFETFSLGRSRLLYREQLAFCREHRLEEARSIYKSSGYPEFDAEARERLTNIRIPEHLPYLSNILRGKTPSRYRDVLEKAARNGKKLKDYLRFGMVKFEGAELLEFSDPVQVHSKHTIIPGFYGLQGQSVMSSSITSHFSRDLNRVAAEDDLVKKVGVAVFVHAVLVPELAVKLIMQDFKVGQAGALEIMEESADVGALVNGEEDDVVAENDE